LHYKRKSILWDESAISQRSGHALAIREAYRVLKKDGYFIWKDVFVRYNIPFFKFHDVYIQDLGKTPPSISRKAIRNYAFYAVYSK